MVQLKATRYYRSLLEPREQAAYDQLLSGWMGLQDPVIIRNPPRELGKLIEAIMADYPLLFYVNYYLARWVSHPDHIRLEGSYLYPRDEAAGLLEQCVRWGRALLAGMPQGLNRAEQALWIHDALACRVRYGNDNGNRAHNILGVILDGMAVCEGIAKCYKFLCDLAQIPCAMVSGELAGVGHGWNLIWLGSQAGFVDVTADLEEPGRCSRFHFLRSDEEMPGYLWDRTRVPRATLGNPRCPVSDAATAGELAARIRAIRPGQAMGFRLPFPMGDGDDGWKRLQRELNRRLWGCGEVRMHYFPDQRMLFVTAS